MNALVLVAQAESGGQIAQIAQTFGVDWPHLIAQMISFCILCLLLHRFAYKPVLKMLESRRQVITQSFANADKVKAELAGAETHRQEVMVQANAQAGQFIDEARVAAEGLLKQETQKATAAAEEIIARARQATAQDHARMLAELKREVGRLVVETTSAVTGKILTTEDHRRLAEETERQLAA
jgi:F-type H+-transporting ATPase subunit b